MGYTLEKSKHKRFSLKRYGRGWTPSSPQGRTITITYLLFVIWRSMRHDQGILSADQRITYLIPLLGATASLITICYLAGPTPRRQRGSSTSSSDSMDTKNKHIALALGGGATKGLLHIGVLRYLEEQNYTIDQIAGTSMGALIGALIAAGRNSHEIESIFQELNNTDLIDFSLSTLTLKGQKITNKIEEVFGQMTFEELDIPFKVVVTNIDSGEEVVYESGPLIDALRYTISVPGVFALYDRSKPLIDGGVVNNLPINHLDHEHIVAVSCRGYGGFETEKNTSLWGRTLPESSISFNARVLKRSLLVMMRRIEDMMLIQYPNTILIRPYSHDISPIDINVLQDAITRGYDEAKTVLG